MNYWMFICNPKMWDADQFFDDGHTAGIWKANQQKVSPGDKGVLRVSHLNSEHTSIYAIAEVLSRPDFSGELNPELVAVTEQYWNPEAKAKLKGDELFIELKYSLILVHHPIRLSEIAAVGGTDRNLFEGRQASCFKLNDVTFWKIENLAKMR